MSSFENFLSNLDIFSVNPNYIINSQRKVSSAFSCFLSFIFLLLFIFLSYYNMMEFLNLDKKFVLSLEQPDQESIELNL
jgi:hypothetical protein